MGPFTKWMIKNGRMREDFNTSDPSDKFKFNNDSDMPRDYEKDFQELSKVIAAKYFKDFTQFAQRLADERGDQEIKDLLSKIELEKKNAPDDNWKPRHPKDKDVISTPMADRGADQNGGESNQG